MSRHRPRAPGGPAGPRRVSWLLGAVGVAVVGAGLLLFVRPGLAAGDLPTGFELTAVGVVSALLGLVAVRRRLRGEFDAAVTPAPEERESLSVPGDDVDRALFPGPGAGRGFAGDSRERVAERLREATLAVLERYDGCSRAEAERRIETGAWTDDAMAAAFFTGEAPEASLSERLRRSIANESAFQRRARAVVAVLLDRVARTDCRRTGGEEG